MFERIISLCGKEFTFRSESKFVDFEFDRVDYDDNISEYELKVNIDCEDVKPLTVKWSNHMVGLLSFWSPTVKRDRGVKQWYNANSNLSNMYYGAPIISVIKQGDRNFSTVAVSDAVNPVKMTFSVNDFEEKENLDFHLSI